jgi:Fe-S cluster assembly protein SufD
MAVSTHPDEWFHGSLPGDISSRLSDPQKVKETRKKAFTTFLETPVETDPLYKKHLHLSGIDLRDADPLHEGKPVDMPRCLPGEVIVVHDSSGTRVAVSPELSKGGLVMMPLSEVWKSEEAAQQLLLSEGSPSMDKFEALNLALVNRGFLLRVPDKFQFPVRVKETSVLSGKGEALAVRRFLQAGTLSRLFHSEEVYCSSKQPGQRLYSSSTSIAAGNDSDVISLTGHAPDDGTVSFYNRYLTAASNANVSWLFSGVDGFRTTLRNLSRLQQRGGMLSDYQVYFGDGEHSITSYVKVVHEADDTRGQSQTRGVFRDNSRGTFLGLMKIDPNVRKVFSYLSEHAMLLSKSARADTIPGMEISSAMDVKASHSSAVAPLDPERVFYVQSRGLDENHATRLIAQGFLSNVISKAPLEGLENALSVCLDARWDGRHLGWAGHHLGWVGRSLCGTVMPNEATWRAPNEVRIDSKLR